LYIAAGSGNGSQLLSVSPFIKPQFFFYPKKIDFCIDAIEVASWGSSGDFNNGYASLHSNVNRLLRIVFTLVGDTTKSRKHVFLNRSNTDFFHFLGKLLCYII
jgi:hypothetical protein